MLPAHSLNQYINVNSILRYLRPRSASTRLFANTSRPANCQRLTRVVRAIWFLSSACLRKCKI